MDAGCVVTDNLKAHRIAPNKLPDHVVKKSRSFYEQPDISWVSPGRKDFITVKQDGRKQKVQKQYLMTTVREAFALFCDKYADVNISFSKFADLRPEHICLYSKFPHNVCLCRDHENVRLGLKFVIKRTSSHGVLQIAPKSA